MKKIILYLDTSVSETTKVELIIDEKRFQRIFDAKQMRSQVVLPLIEEMLRDNALNLADISQIKLNTGPGSFTGLRVGISVAQTIGALFNIPVNGTLAGRLIPLYKDSKW